VAYEKLDQAIQGRQIWVIEVENGRRQQLTNDKDYRDERPSWSADGSRILFVRLSNESASIWLMNADGSNPKQIVPELTPRPDPLGEYGHIAWGLWWDWSHKK
jgi:Tol biopolymer transport system component